MTIPQSEGTQAQRDSGTGRGHIALQRQCVFPKSQDDRSVLNVRACKLAKALSRAQELAKSTCFGFLQRCAWDNIRKVQACLNAEQGQHLDAILRGAPSCKAAAELCRWLEHYLSLEK